MALNIEIWERELKHRHPSDNSVTPVMGNYPIIDTAWVDTTPAMESMKTAPQIGGIFFGPLNFIGVIDSF